MVATRILNYGPPIPASPARLKANQAKLSYIQAWLRDFTSEGIPNKAGELTSKLASIGYDSLELFPPLKPSQLAALGILAIHAQMIIRDACALHHHEVYTKSLLHPPVQFLSTRKRKRRKLGQLGLMGAWSQRTLQL